VKVSRTGCEGEELLKDSTTALLLGIGLFLLFFLYAGVWPIVKRLEVKYHITVYYYAYMPSRLLIEFLLPQIDLMRFSSTPFLELPMEAEIDKLDAVSFIVQIVALEFVFVAAYAWSFSVFVSFYAFLRAFLMMANMALGADDKTRKVLLGCMSKWKADGFPESVRGLPLRLHQQSGKTLSVDIFDLAAAQHLMCAEDMAEYQEAAEVVDCPGDLSFKGRKEYARWLLKDRHLAVVAPRFIFITTTEEIVDVWEGTIEPIRSGKRDA